MNCEIIPIKRLKPLEKVFVNHLANIERMIHSDGYILKALIADVKTGILLDGSHRYAFLLKNGYRKAPVHFVDYLSEDIRVGTRLRHRFLVDGDTGISKDECVRRALAGDLFSPRTTRHFFPFRKNDISLPLDMLDKGEERPIDFLYSDANVADEIEHNKKYLDEIYDETEVIVKYLAEINETKEYLQKQIDLMDRSRAIAFFPGKFHPPHIGHMQTILNILPQYRKVIVGVSGDIPSENALLSPDQIAITLRELFASFDNVEVVLFKGVLVKRAGTEGLPTFDVLVSGNPQVIEWAEDRGVAAQYIERSHGALSSTSIRRMLCHGLHDD